ncbi:MAG TPA: 4Fe-4S binding protein [Candidatus Omnitrophota bacterium]|nr:4Fe-4S binding protein [Candidatus Omnitrophota bacterium]
MAYQINADECTSCGACELDCPTGSIAEKGGTYVIKAKTCTECDGDDPKCVELCPVENCITLIAA